jgi:small multidrug resistance pump
MQWWILGLAILAETIATSALKASDGFTKLIPSVIVVAGYACAFYGLSVTLRTMPVGVAYAVWSGVGIVLVALIGWYLYGQRLDTATLVGMAMIIGGVVVMHVFSKGPPV